MLEADAVEGVMQLDIDPEVVGVELQPVARRKPGFLRNIQGQCGDRSGAGETPVAITLGFDVES